MKRPKIVPDPRINPSENPGACGDVAAVFVERESEGHSRNRLDTNPGREDHPTNGTISFKLAVYIIKSSPN